MHFYLLSLFLGRLWRRKWELLRLQSPGCQVPEEAFACLQHADVAIFQNVYVLLAIVCVFPLTTCTCERCNSALKRLKTRLRNMTTERLSGLTMMNLYPSEKIDLEKVLDRFASMKQRSADLAHPRHQPPPDLF